MKYLKYFSCLLLFFAFSCSSEEPAKIDFDRDAMLVHVGEDIIIPRYELLNNSVNDLETSTLAFTSDITEENLEALKVNLKQAQLKWQACSYFNFGPAGNFNLKTTINTYPVSETKIEQNIQTGSYNLGDGQNIDTKGFPAMEYLLYGTGSNKNEVLSFYESQEAQQYLQDVVNDIKTSVSAVTLEWKTSYIDFFKTQNGIDAGSSLSLLVNELNLDFERNIRDGKIGIPLGVRSLGTPQPDKVESLYGMYSLELAKECILQMENLFKGITPTGEEGLSIEDNLIEIGNSTGGNLASTILSQFNEIKTSLDAIDTPIQDAVLTNTSTVQSAYNKMQQMVVYLKVDLSSSLGVLITYQDNDGD